MLLNETNRVFDNGNNKIHQARPQFEPHARFFAVTHESDSHEEKSVGPVGRHVD